MTSLQKWEVETDGMRLRPFELPDNGTRYLIYVNRLTFDRTWHYVGSYATESEARKMALDVYGLESPSFDARGWPTRIVRFDVTCILPE